MKKTNSPKTKNSPKFQPLGDRVLVKPQFIEEKTSKLGLIIPDSANKEKPETGKVIAVGEGRVLENGIKIKMNVKIGDIVIFSKYGPDEIKLNGEEYLILREEQILGIIK